MVRDSVSANCHDYQETEEMSTQQSQGMTDLGRSTNVGLILQLYALYWMKRVVMDDQRRLSTAQQFLLGPIRCSLTAELGSSKNCRPLWNHPLFVPSQSQDWGAWQQWSRVYQDMESCPPGTQFSVIIVLHQPWNIVCLLGLAKEMEQSAVLQVFVILWTYSKNVECSVVPKAADYCSHWTLCGHSRYPAVGWYSIFLIFFSRKYLLCALIITGSSKKFFIIIIFF